VKTIALAGNPNSGKTALFNLLTGSRHKVANYAGVTVEKKEGRVTLPVLGESVLVDLPGIYTLEGRSIDERISSDVLRGKNRSEAKPDALIVVVDATNLERHLALVLELKTLQIPMVLALNMMDLARDRKLEIDLEVFSKELGIRVVPTIATQSVGALRLLKDLEWAIQDEKVSLNRLPYFENAHARFQEVDRILKAAIRRPVMPSVWTERIDRVVLHPILGTIVLAIVLLTVFQSIFTLASIPQDWIRSGIEWGSLQLSALLNDGFLKSLLIEGVIAGVGSVLVFLPQILILFTMILLLEDSGYLARAAFLMDRLMRLAGLNGRAFIPLLSSYACAIPGIMATRTIPTARERLITILIAPLTTCSARLPVYSLLVGAFIPHAVVWGPITLPALVLFGLYLLGILSALVVSLLLRLSVFRGQSSAFVLELPTYKRPHLKSLLTGLVERAQVFLRRAGTVILGLSVLIWFSVSYPKPPGGYTEPPISYSVAGRLGRLIEPVFAPLGFTWKVDVALIPAMAAREVMVSALSTVFAVEKNEKDDSGGQVSESLAERLKLELSLPAALSLLVWYVYACQCISTLAVTRRETNSWRWPSFMFIYMTFLAYGAAWVTYRVASACLGGV